MPQEEYLINDRVLLLSRDQVEIRSRCYDGSKMFRTNSTLKIVVEQRRCRHYTKWNTLPKFDVWIPHETPAKTIPVIVFALAYGWTPVEFTSLVTCLAGDLAENTLLSTYLYKCL
jgi:hypothetical protein